MPLGKYYCDYCEKQFQDTAAARKRHLQGAQHKRARALWYDSIRHHDQHGGASTLLLPDGTLAKGICHHFVRTGTCKYGDSCRYIHPRSDAVSPALAASEYIAEWVQFGGYFDICNPILPLFLFGLGLEPWCSSLIFLAVNPILVDTRHQKGILSQGTY
ncbi:zinc finger CCCH domain-containing protein 3 isoform X3 [Phragmites australis]|uniref:zinc finger CCCH domain-containing protein 3 isoform X3 n=1 Tax=Phragmites australis TaxID=29695 RepID=UPI002D76D293|nr:zinc finger CCCH domain-containing protein 3 isoform X3 [Phragmites australis]